MHTPGRPRYLGMTFIPCSSGPYILYSTVDIFLSCSNAVGYVKLINNNNNNKSTFTAVFSCERE